MEHKDMIDFGYLYDAIFEPNFNSEWEIHGCEAIIFLAREYAKVIHEDPAALRFNELCIMETLKRFVRDAWGLRMFGLRVEGLFTKMEIPKAALDVVKAEASKNLGIRINTDTPRKTRVAAVFSLWMSTLRPIYIEGAQSTQADLGATVRFCAAFTFAACCAYLEQYGSIVLGTTKNDIDTRTSHIVRDFHCRHLALSPLELLFCSIFRA